MARVILPASLVARLALLATTPTLRLRECSPVRVAAVEAVREVREPAMEEAAEVVRVVQALPRQAPLLCRAGFPPLPSRLLRWAGRAEVGVTPIAPTQAALNGAVVVERVPEPQTTSVRLAVEVCTAAVVVDAALA